ncbi:adenosylcobinamide amidohydrolase [Halomarina ordinaria]|uniref:Adenosylcobinamide amidohydrolase n=1 Tax=Halomarina ordinaria TaxID=3033939 RepID=A0ABD5UDJ1_9EURY|nr:adenosylcobinamide amidohydrolase [Halomarina sp. PSRA2]
MAYSTDLRAGVGRLRSDERARWLSSGWRGGFTETRAAYNVSVPDGWPEVDLDAYGAERRERAGFEDGPTLFTGVDARHARCARLGPVTCLATAGVSNPAALPVGEATPTDDADTAVDSVEGSSDSSREPPGTVNVLLGTTTALTDGALAGLLGVAVEAKTATLLATTGFPGTTTDAAVVGCRVRETPDPFAGSATEVGGAARACVREAVRASLDSRYSEDGWAVPGSVEAAKYGLSTTARADVFVP